MLKRNPIIAALMLALALGGILWAVVFIGKQILHNPIDQLTSADIPASALNLPEHDFSQIVPIPDSSVPSAAGKIPAGLPDVDFGTSSFRSIISNEEKYAIAAETKSALDPLKDEYLRSMLKELIDLKTEFEFARTNAVIKLHQDFVADIGTNQLRFNFFDRLASDSLVYSLENPKIFPLRQAEALSEFYTLNKDKAGDLIQVFNSQFATAIIDDLDDLKSQQDDVKSLKVNEIRDYLIEKTTEIEKEFLNGNSSED